MSWLSKILTKNKPAIGLQLDGSRLSYCLLERSSFGPKILAAGVMPFESSAEHSDIKRELNKLNAKGRSAVWVLPSNRYRLMTIDKPAVPDEELEAAIQWQIKDLIDTTLEQAVICSFPYPKQMVGAEKLYVVVAAKHDIEAIIQLSDDAGLSLLAIEIEELTIGRILSPQLHGEQNVAFIAETAGGLTINCFMGNEFAFTRSLPGVYLPSQTSEFTLDDEAGNSVASVDDEQWLLEVQRTLDYYESQIAKRNISKVIIPELSDATELIVEQLKSNLGLQVEVFSVADICQYEPAAISGELAQYFPILGGALRQQVGENAAG